MADLLTALYNIAQGRQGDMAEDKLSANVPSYMPTTDKGVTGQVDAVPFGSLADPVSQAAMLASPGILQSIGQFIKQAAVRSGRQVVPVVAEHATQVPWYRETDISELPSLSSGQHVAQGNRTNIVPPEVQKDIMTRVRLYLERKQTETLTSQERRVLEQMRLRKEYP